MVLRFFFVQYMYSISKFDKSDVIFVDNSLRLIVHQTLISWFPSIERTQCIHISKYSIGSYLYMYIFQYTETIFSHGSEIHISRNFSMNFYEIFPI